MYYRPSRGSYPNHSVDPAGHCFGALQFSARMHREIGRTLNIEEAHASH